MWRILKDSEIIRGQTRSACFQQIGIHDCVYQAGIQLSYFRTQLLNLKFTCKVCETIKFGGATKSSNHASDAGVFAGGYKGFPREDNEQTM